MTHLDLRVLRIGLMLCLACGGSVATETTPETDVEPGVLLDAAGELGEGDMQIGAAYSDPYEFQVNAGDELEVEVIAEDFDPILEVVPPGEGALVNDDWQGDRTRSRIELVARVDGSLKVRVSSYSPSVSGHYRVRVARRVEASVDTGTAVATAPMTTRGASIAAVLTSGQSLEGTLEQGDPRGDDNRPVDTLLVDVVAGQPQALAVTSEGAVEVRVVDPQGRAIRASEGRAELVQEGHYRVQVIGAAGASATYQASLSSGAANASAAPQLDRTHHLPLAGGTAEAVQIGQRVNARLEDSDPELPSGERADLYQFTGRPGQNVAIEMASSELDSYLLMVGPGGEFWENDDSSALNSRIEVALPAAGTYRVIATTYRADMRGAYELKVFDAARAAQPTTAVAATSTTPTPATGALAGSLTAGDRQLPSGEFVDEHQFELRAGERTRFEAISTEFDTYLMVREPGGQQHDNDDQVPGNTNAAVDLVAAAPGTYTVLVTSYRPGETGSYRLVRGGAGAATTTTPPVNTPPVATPPTNTPTPAVAGTVGEQRGALASADAQLDSGEFVDRYTMQFEAGRPVQVRLDATGFDPYLIVVSPSGHQSDNDDFGAGSLNSGLDIPSAEAGDYVVMVTSYQPGETGSYVLRTGRGLGGPAPANGGTGAPVAAGSGQLYGIFTGISDYPGNGSDLPECANDAIKLAQTLRESGMMPAGNQIVLTDSQVTIAGVRQAFAQMGRRVGADDTFIFFYSGHGNQRGGSTDEREIDGTDETIVLYDQELVDDEMATLFDGIQGLGLLTLDACFAGGFAKDVITQPGRMGLFSSEEDVLSSVAGQFQAGGYLSHFLRTGMGGEADTSPRDNVLTAGELQHYLVSQFGTHVRDVRLNGAWQHLVVDRGAVRSDEALYSFARR